jgi:hypothetical protein
MGKTGGVHDVSQVCGRDAYVCPLVGAQVRDGAGVDGASRGSAGSAVWGGREEMTCLEGDVAVGVAVGALEFGGGLPRWLGVIIPPGLEPVR